VRCCLADLLLGGPEEAHCVVVEDVALLFLAEERASSTYFAVLPHHCQEQLRAGTLEWYYSMDDDRHMASPAPEKLFGRFVYDGEIDKDQLFLQVTPSSNGRRITSTQKSGPC
jgi:hypothetical protein